MFLTGLLRTNFKWTAYTLGQKAILWAPLQHMKFGVDVEESAMTNEDGDYLSLSRKLSIRNETDERDDLTVFLTC